MEDKIILTGRLEGGYGIIPISTFKRTGLNKLTIQEAGLYAYFCSRSGSKNDCFPSVDTICRDLAISKESFGKYKKGLEKKGYISISSEKDERGKFARNVYTILDYTLPYTDNPYTEKPYSDKPNTEYTKNNVNADVQKKPYAEKPDTAGMDTNINSNANSRNININLKKYKKSRRGRVWTPNQSTSNKMTMENHLSNNYNIEKPKNKAESNEIDTFFNNLWDMYPRKRGKGSIKQKQKKILFSVGYEELARAILRYKDEIKRNKISEQYILNGSTFFNTRYVDYLDKNYQKVNNASNSNKFCNFSQKGIDFQKLEKQNNERLEKIANGTL